MLVHLKQNEVYRLSENYRGKLVYPIVRTVRECCMCSDSGGWAAHGARWAANSWSAPLHRHHHHRGEARWQVSNKPSPSPRVCSHSFTSESVNVGVLSSAFCVSDAVRLHGRASAAVLQRYRCTQAAWTHTAASFTGSVSADRRSWEDAASPGGRMSSDRLLPSCCSRWLTAVVG